jgi:hypothetical protein
MDVSLWVRFTATERRERGAAHRVLIEPSLDDPYTALCIIDRAADRPSKKNAHLESVGVSFIPCQPNAIARERSH